jgi:hypothetical protein
MEFNLHKFEKENKKLENELQKIINSPKDSELCKELMDYTEIHIHSDSLVDNFKPPKKGIAKIFSKNEKNRENKFKSIGK